MNINIFGKKSEQIAQKYLKKQGLKIIDVNFHSKFGEIDIIAKSDEKIHFVEVKATSKDYDPLFRITASKYNKILKTIDYYLLKNDEIMSFQIDAVLIKSNQEIEWIQNLSI